MFELISQAAEGSCTLLTGFADDVCECYDAMDEDRLDNVVVREVERRSVVRGESAAADNYFKVVGERCNAHAAFPFQSKNAIWLETARSRALREAERLGGRVVVFKRCPGAESFQSVDEDWFGLMVA